MYVMLGSVPRGRHTVRKHERGPMWVDDATQIDGRWVVRGAVELFTRRGRRMIHVAVGKKYSEGFIVPLPANPGKKYLNWSDWLPRSRRDGKAPFNRLTYRFRVQRRSAPMRVETVGPFEIQTITSAFYYDPIGKQQFIASRDSFRIRYRGAAFTIPAEPEPN